MRAAAADDGSAQLPRTKAGAKRGGARAEQLLDESARKFGTINESWWRWPYASGDWFGVRSWLDTHGVTIELLYTGELAFTDARSREADYRGLLELVTSLSSQRLGLWPGGRVVFVLHQMHGDGVTSANVADLQIISNIDGPSRTQPAELWFHQRFWGGRIQLKLGRQDASVEMAAAQLGNEFVHSSFGLPPNIPLPTFPEPGLGALVALVLPWFEVRLGAYDGAPDGRTSGFDTTFDGRGGTIVLGQATLKTSSFIEAVRVGYLRVGGWYHSGDSAGPVARNTYGFYGIVEQPLWVSDKRRLALLGQVSWASAVTGGVRTYAGGGLAFAGLLPLPGGDIIGFGVASAWLARGNETALEWFYKVGVTGAAFVQLDAQYLHAPSGEDRRALVGLLRFSLQI